MGKIIVEPGEPRSTEGGRKRKEADAPQTATQQELRIGSRAFCFLFPITGTQDGRSRKAEVRKKSPERKRVNAGF